MWTDYTIPADEAEAPLPSADVESQLDKLIAKNETGMHIPYTDDIEATGKGLVITGKPDFHTWYSLWQWLKQRDAAMPWILGDMMLYGEAAFGEAASQVLEETEQEHFKPGTLRDYKYVAGRFPLSSRLYNLGWSYYQTVAGLPHEQAIAQLQHCAEFGIKRAELRQNVKGLNSGSAPKPPAYPDDTNHELLTDNHKKEQQITNQEQTISQQQEYISHLESKLEKLQQAGIMPKPSAIDPADFPDLNDLVRPITSWLQSQQTFSAVLIRRNGEVIIKP